MPSALELVREVKAWLCAEAEAASELDEQIREREISAQITLLEAALAEMERDREFIEAAPHRHSGASQCGLGTMTME